MRTGGVALVMKSLRIVAASMCNEPAYPLQTDSDSENPEINGWEEWVNNNL